jgi:hypothetical protein
LLIAEGHRPGNFKPDAETIDAIQKVMLAAGLTPTTNSTPVPVVDQYGTDQAKKLPQQ